MIRRLAGHTFKNHILTLRFSIGVAMAVIMVVAVTLVQIQDYEARAQAAAQFQRLRLELREGTTAWSMVRTVMEVQPSPLAFMAKGISNAAPNDIVISAGKPATLLEMGYYHAANPLLDFLPDPDVSSIVAFFFSFLAILLSYDLISGAREQGMLRSLLASGVGRLQLLTGLALGGLATLVLIVLLSIGAIVATLQWASTIQLEGNVLGGLAIMSIDILLYCLLFYAIGLLCSCLCKRSSLSLLFGLLAWVVLVIGVPALATQLVVQLDPLPSTESLEQTIREIDVGFQRQVVDYYNQHEPSGGYYGWNTGDIFGFDVRNTHYVVRSPYKELIDFRRGLRVFMEPLRERAISRIEQLQREQENLMLRQTETVALLASVSPGAVLRRLCATAAGTDQATLHRFVESARQLRREYVAFQRSKGYGSLDFTTDQHRNQQPLDLSGLPPLPRMEWNARTVLGDSALDIALLIAPLVIIFLAVGFIFNRYDVR
jgi:ABC-type transport system involved in multi-copper enzyme maturation permease subunit